MHAPLRFCAEPGCPERVPSGRCATHSPVHRRQANTTRLHNLYRTVRWARLREQHMREYPFCVDCLSEGIKRPWDELDHDVPHHGSLTLFWDPNNLKGRCSPHHAQKTRRGQ
jgi:5-methylcytosine-specific restriction protein A